ncbi:MAG: amidohydrolase family protein [Chloroflexi bacterium]|nr:amidohydrolase family protein [Chloroflexota bacterium]
MALVDTHVHFWDPSELTYQWLFDDFERAYLPSDYLLEAGDAAPDGIVFVEAGCQSGTLAEVEWVRHLADTEPRIVGIIAHATLEDATLAAGQLEGLTATHLVKGIRRMLQDQPMSFITDANLVTGVQALSKRDLTFDICIVAEQLPAAISLVKQCPDVQFVLNHVANPNIATGQWQPWAEQLAELAQSENVACKLSGMITQTGTRSWQPDDLRRYFDHALSSFGPQRLMFGSDFPILHLAGSYSDWISALTAAIQSLSAQEQNYIFFETARSIYRLDVTALLNKKE